MDLILNTFGTSLSKEGNNFVVVHKDGQQRIAPDKIKSISVSKGASVTSDAALLAIENGIDILFVDHSGKPVGRLWSIKYGSISTIRRNQLDFTLSSKAVKWIKDIIARKIDNQIALLLTLSPDHDEAPGKKNALINRLEVYRKKVKGAEGEIVSDIAPSLRGWEGASSKVYFEFVSNMLPDNYRYKERSQHPAMDIFNCLLNYGYGILYGKVESALIRSGIDPYVGVFHRDDYNRPVLVFDVIELFRVWIDYVVINLCLQQAITPECYSIKSDGSHWLEALGKRILIQSVNDYLDEIISLDGADRSRLNHIDLYAQKLASMFHDLR